NDSDGTFNALVGRQGVEVFADPNEDHVHEYTAQGLWTVNIQDANGDKRPESVMVTFAGEQRFDRNENGNAEFVRTVHAELCMTDTASDGTPDSADIEVHAYQTYDIGDNGTIQYRAALDLAASTRDANNDGHNESAQMNVTAYEALDRDNDSFDELARGIEVSFAATDANSNGFPERVDGRVYLDGRADPNPDGIVRNTIEDQQPDRVELRAGATQDMDFNSDGLVDETRGAPIDLLAVDANSNGAYESTNVTIHGSAVRDAKHDGVPEYTAAF